jgi:GDP-L-fucose synthase
MATNNTMLLTGGTGMVGQNIQEHSSADDYTILAPTSNELDLTDAAAVIDFLSKNKPNIIVHAAGKVGGIQANINNPIEYFTQNIAIGNNIIMGAYRTGVRKFLNLASSCMYPCATQSPLKEDMLLSGPLEPTNEGYALAKIVSTRLCQYICKEDTQALYKTLIPCNLFGLYDKFDPENSHLVPAIIHKLHNAKTQQKSSVQIWGDGTARREFMFAGDLADAVFKAIGEIEHIPHLMNIGVGFDYSINDYYHTVAEIVGWKGTFTHDITKPVGMKQKLSSIELQENWGWFSQTPLREGLKQTYAHFRERIVK